MNSVDNATSISNYTKNIQIVLKYETMCQTEWMHFGLAPNIMD